MSILNKITNGDTAVICKTKEEFKEYLNILSTKGYIMDTCQIKSTTVDGLSNLFFDDNSAYIIRHYNLMIRVPIFIFELSQTPMVDFTNIISWQGF